jgi:hypothetical protein
MFLNKKHFKNQSQLCFQTPLITSLIQIQPLKMTKSFLFHLVKSREVIITREMDY